MARSYYSQRQGNGLNHKKRSFAETAELFSRLYAHWRREGYFDESFGFECVDEGLLPGKVADVELELFLALGKDGLWPVSEKWQNYSEDDLFDVIEFLYEYVSKPLTGQMHDYGNCGMHWEVFDQGEGQLVYREKVNTILSHYERPFVLSDDGEVLQKPESGFEPIFTATIPSDDPNIVSRVDAATRKYRRHGSSLDDRRQAVRDLADVLEYLRPSIQSVLNSKDESDLFNIANNFGIRHHNERQKTGYDAAIWLSWMFYFYLATIHAVLRKIGMDDSDRG